MNSNGVLAWVGSVDEMGDELPAHKGRNHWVVRVI